MQEDEIAINAKKEVVSYEDFTMRIRDITMLSIKEYKQYRNIIPHADFWWWLWSPGEARRDAACVTSGGWLYYNDVDISSLRVRPAIVCEPSCLEPGDKVKLFEMNWTALNPSLLLCDESIGCSAFRKDWKAPDANNYDVSDVKKFIQNWATKEVMNNV